MEVVVHTDDLICADEELIRRLEGVLEGSLDGLTGQIRCVEVYLRDLNSPRMGEKDKRCELVARTTAAGRITASHEAATLTEAIHDAAGRLKRAVFQHLRQAERSGDAAALPAVTATLLQGVGAATGSGESLS